MIYRLLATIMGGSIMFAYVYYDSTYKKHLETKCTIIRYNDYNDYVNYILLGMISGVLFGFWLDCLSINTNLISCTQNSTNCLILRTQKVYIVIIKKIFKEINYHYNDINNLLYCWIIYWRTFF